MSDMKYRARLLLHKLTLDVDNIDEFDEKINDIVETALLQAYNCGLIDGVGLKKVSSKPKPSFWSGLFSFISIIYYNILYILCQDIQSIDR